MTQTGASSPGQPNPSAKRSSPSHSPSEEETLVGDVQRIVFRNPSNGYTVFDLHYETKKAPGDRSTRRGRTTVAGLVAWLSEGLHVAVRGSFIIHPKFGKQFSATSVTSIDPTSTEGIERYLASGMIKGIGRGTAKKIVAALGDDTLKIIETDPTRLSEIPGVGKHKAALIQEAFSNQSAVQQIKQFLISHGMSPNLADRIYRRYGGGAVDTITADPYILARDLKGVGFRTADLIATGQLSLPHDSPQRVRAGLSYTLEKAADDGHCFLPKAAMLKECQKLLALDSPLLADTALQELIGNGTLICSTVDSYEAAISLPEQREAEEFVASFVGARSGDITVPCLESHELHASIKKAAEALNLTFSPEQEEAVLAATQHPLMVITGGPGCGKTTLIRALSQVFRSAGKRLLLTAPTGRAAQRMSQVCEMNASTIHRLLKFQKGSFVHGPEEPLVADCIIVDEASMVDLFLAKSLFGAIPEGCRLILVGDKDQLPSVGPGRVFADLIAAPSVKTVRLSRLFRREEDSSINSIAHQINVGIMPDVPAPDGKTKVDAYFLQQDDPEKAASLIERLVSDQIPKKFGFALPDIMVLSPSNRGPLGVQSLNLRLQSRLNPHGLHEEIEVNPSLTLRDQDRVVQRVNNYQIHEAGVFNGDSGTIYSLDPDKRQLRVDLWDGRIIAYRERDIPQLSLAYAMTVHRSQGSEIPCVVLVLHHTHYTMLERQLVYTAVTRAKKLLIVVGTKRALAIASKRTTAQDRFTSLRELVEKASGSNSLGLHDESK